MSWQAVEPLVHENAHGRPENLDPRVNGPFLEDVRADQERAYKESRNVNAVSNDDTVDMEPVTDDDDSE
jgi:hypothetical protein